MTVPESYFASPDRSSPDELRREKDAVHAQNLFTKALHVFPKIVLVLNHNRQIIYTNEKLCRLLGVTIDDILGKRPGELFGCVHAFEQKAGCGTSLFCRECGAVKSILDALDGQSSMQECRMTVKREGQEASLDLRVWAVPFSAGEERFVAFTIDDIGDEKRREALERTFFHDVLNEAAVLHGYLENINEGVMSADPQTTSDMHRFAKAIIHTIQSQRDLLQAEQGSLAVHKETFGVLELLKELAEGYGRSKEGARRSVALEGIPNEALIKTDRVLLGRVIGNLIKNALEASRDGGKVTVRYRKENGGHLFSVHNETVMPENVRLQVFQRSFSTKGRGRGIGTYSVKFFTENYLKGKVRFESAEGSGTTFFVELDE